MKNKLLVPLIVAAVLASILAFVLAATFSNPVFQKPQQASSSAEMLTKEVEIVVSANKTIAQATFANPSGQTIKILNDFYGENSFKTQVTLHPGETVSVNVLTANTKINDEDGSSVKCLISQLQKNGNENSLLSENSAEISDSAEMFPVSSAICTYTFRG